MKKLKNEAKEWIFENLLRLLFRFANSHKLVKFVKRPKDNSIYYDIQFKSEKVEESKIKLIEALENYLTKLTNKDVDQLEENSTKEPTRIIRENVECAIRIAEIVNNTAKQIKSDKNFNEAIKENESDKESWVTQDGAKAYMKAYKDLEIKNIKRAINENGYEIISEVKNGFIIARIGRHNENPAWNTTLIKPIQGEPSDYTHKLIGSLKDSDELIKDSLSTSDFGGEDLVAEDLDNQLREQEQIDFNKFIEEEEIKKFAKENRLYRFLDEDPDKYMERVKSAMRSKFTKSSLHPMSRAIDTIVEQLLQ